MTEAASGGSSGPSTDRHNEPVRDPTPNVLDLVEQAIQRQDDLREAENIRQNDLRTAETRHVREIDKLLVDHARELRDAEAKRIDAIRAVDVGAVASAASVQATQATTLAAQVATSAETLRNQVAAAATQGAIALAAALDPIQKDIADLRRVQYESVGQKTQVVEQQASGANTGLWIGLAFGAFGLLISFSAIAVTLYLASQP